MDEEDMDYVLTRSLANAKIANNNLVYSLKRLSKALGVMRSKLAKAEALVVLVKQYLDTGVIDREEAKRLVRDWD